MELRRATPIVVSSGPAGWAPAVDKYKLDYTNYSDVVLGQVMCSLLRSASYLILVDCRLTQGDHGIYDESGREGEDVIEATLANDLSWSHLPVHPQCVHQCGLLSARAPRAPL